MREPPVGVIIGGGGHALVVAEAGLLCGHALAGFYDDDPEALLGRAPVAGRAAGLPYLGPLECARVTVLPGPWILGVGDLELRRWLGRALAAQPAGVAAAVVHPDARASPSATLAAGVFVGPGAVLGARARVEPHAIINSGAVVEHECHIASGAHVAPGAVLGGRVRVGADALIGLGARVLPNRSIGQGAVVGAGAVVVSDVPDGCVVVGVPAASRPRRS